MEKPTETDGVTSKNPPPRLSRENAAQELRELWVFAVTPETCNLACTHCLYAASPMRRNPYRLSAEEIAELMEQVNTVKAKPHFLFTGGEPTLHPQLLEFLEAVDGAGYSTQLMTNGTRMRKETAKRLSKMSHLAKVQVSLESTDPQINDSIYGEGLHRRVLKALDTLREQGVPVALAVTPMKDNEDGLQSIEELASAKGADVKYISLYDLGAAKENRLNPAKQSLNGRGNRTPNLMCEKGVAYSEGAFYPCPVLVKEPGTKLGNNLEEALSPKSRQRIARLREVHSACQVCLKGST
ncbi:MAG: radical SAM protein [Candidatus Binatia bacterium]